MRNTQRGASYTAILLGVIVAAFGLKVLVALWQPYWDDRLINQLIEEQVAISSKATTPQQFASTMGQKFSMNNIRDIEFKDIATVKSKQGLQVTKKYEVRKPFLFNIDLVLTFEKSFDQRSVQSK
ncbi:MULTISPECIES: DUF4845 domain-containing protein [unclassified Acinetobacter]|uniref:DUF4845 domain-containing protein n=1 Tax=unclassified Acinetobacter TaxID=196816 RepID=UPI0004506455|nr:MULTISPECIES: DUF4845 domain-containing protein [unclassified Acinetobacter]EZQ10102.1 signal peptide protein [Acinetobacter sp. Ver3]SEL88387.1 protein of unknown function [Acinetobacter sp. DSM 11652]